jgi:hypothetical protein
MVMPNAVLREQAYLSSLGSQPKDIAPDRLYEVRPASLINEAILKYV